jgi:hypothetical protein
MQTGPSCSFLPSPALVAHLAHYRARLSASWVSRAAGTHRHVGLRPCRLAVSPLCRPGRSDLSSILDFART